jgi:transcription-repair coupling factor (superfamily II helicase)
MQPVPDPAHLDRQLLTLRVGDGRGPAWLVRWLDEAGYRRCDAIEEPGDYAVRGGIVDVFPPGDPARVDPGEAQSGALAMSPGGVPVRLDYFGDELEKVAEIDLASMGIDRTVGGVRLVASAAPGAGDDTPDDGRAERGTTRARSAAATPAKRGKGAGAGVSPPDGKAFTDLLPPGTLAVLHELMELTEQGRGYFERVTGEQPIFGPPAVFAGMGRACGAVIEVTAIGAYGSAEGAGLVRLPFSPLPAFPEDLSAGMLELARMARGDLVSGMPPCRVTVVCETAAEHARLAELLAERTGEEGMAEVQTALAHLPTGFVYGPEDGVPRVFAGWHELLHRPAGRRTTGGPRLKAGRAMDTFLDLQVGDYVVHAEHGIARFTGLKVMSLAQVKSGVEDRLRLGGSARTGKGKAAARGEPAPGSDQEEFLSLEFAEGAVLHVPASKIDQVSKYIGGFNGKPPLSVLGGARWKNQKARVSESVKDLAAELLRVRAARNHLPGIRYPGDTAWQQRFEDEFPHQETEDQLAALSEIKKDMQRERPMDRLVCGDVGYGKTELAIRAAFKAVEFGKQVAVLVPTTVLAEQHERTFRARFAEYPFRIESVSRFKSDGEITPVLEDVQRGRVDVLIGTHRILSSDVVFADLGLVIIDEEQRFGVEHKEKLLGLRMTVDVLTLSATPIPRTLHMSLLGIRDISSLTTAPADRRAVVTELVPWNDRRLGQVIARELARDGQVYFVHNRVYDIHEVAQRVQAMAPQARIVVGHGQMAPKELEEVMLRFMRKQADILVSTTIIESGIDISSANTMIIADADRFGLADLHQLRGRVGRYKNRAYCYLLLPENRAVKEKARKRLAAIEQFSMLGAGFKIAMRDLEIRGAGNILGPEQSGHIAAVGYDMYCQLLERAVKGLKNEVVAQPSEVSVELGVTGLIPRPYIPSDARRLEAYRRIALAAYAEALDKVVTDLTGAYGPVPEPADRLLQLAEVRIGARSLGVRAISVTEKDLIFRTTEPGAVVRAMAGGPGSTVVPPTIKASDVPEVYFRPDNPAALQPGTLLAILRKRIGVRAGQASPATGPRGNAAAPSGTQGSTPDAAHPAGPHAGSHAGPGGQSPPAATPGHAKPLMPRINKPTKDLARVTQFIKQARRQSPKGPQP